MATVEEAAREYSIVEGQRAAVEFLKGLPSGQAPQGLVDLFELIYRETARAGFIAGATFGASFQGAGGRPLEEGIYVAGE